MRLVMISSSKLKTKFDFEICSFGWRMNHLLIVISHSEFDKIHRTKGYKERDINKNVTFFSRLLLKFIFLPYDAEYFPSSVFIYN